MNDPGFVEVDGFRLRPNIDLIPQRGMQENTAASDANLILLGGSGTSGKTFIGLMAYGKGLGYPGFTGRIVTMQSKDDQKGTSMKRDAEQIFGGFAECELSTSGGITAEWKQWNNSLKWIHVNFNVNNPNEWELYKAHCKANTAGYFYWDEITGVQEWKKFSYMFSRNRDSSGAMRPKTIVSFNPEYEHWTTKLLKMAGYIGKDWYFIPEMNGKITYFYSGAGDEIEDVIVGKTKREVVEKAHITISDEERAFGMKPEDMVKSMQVFIGSPIDNKILVNITKGESIANLAAVGKTEGAKMHKSYFGPSSSGNCKITQEVIKRFFTNPVSDIKEQRYATLDASGGGDLMVMWIWRGKTLIGREDICSSNPVEIEKWVVRCLVKWGISYKNFAYDGGGLGFFLKRFKDGYCIINNMKPIQEIDSYGNTTDSHLEYYNLRAQLMAKFEAMMITGELSSEIPLDTMFPHTKKRTMTPLFDILDKERVIFQWYKKNQKIIALSKDEFKSKYGYSPDATDALWMVARFWLDDRPKKQEETEFTESDYYCAFNEW